MIQIAAMLRQSDGPSGTRSSPVLGHSSSQPFEGLKWPPESLISSGACITGIRA